MADNVITIDPIQRLNRDLKNAAKILTPGEARYLVDAYYTIQDYRKAAGNQIRALGESGEPNTLIEWFFGQYETLENNIKKTLDIYTDNHPVGVWTKSITGIGPVIAAGLLAHIDITKAPTVGHIWSFAGLDPNRKWEKGQKRPWNARLKVLCWKIGESFVKVSNNPKDIYGKIYKARKELEQIKNEAREFAVQAATILQTKKIGKDTEAFKHYSVGMLPPAHIQERAKRYAVKIFLAHLHEVWYRWHYGEMPPKPYVIEHLGHVHKIEPPNLRVMEF
jgi:hypothetical protein